MSYVIAIANQKGGVAKTTSTITLAHALAYRGKRVLTLDLDPQSNLTLYFKLDPEELEEQQRTLYWALKKDGFDMKSLIVSGPPDIIPSGPLLEQAEREFLYEWDSVSFIKDKLKPLHNLYEYILIDCRPTLTLLTVNGLVASNGVLIPCATEYFSVIGIKLLLNTIEEVRQRPNPFLEILGILPTRYDSRNRHDKDALEELFGSFADHYKIFDPINKTTRFNDASVEGRPILDISPKHSVTENYYKVADFIIDHYAKRN